MTTRTRRKLSQPDFGYLSAESYEELAETAETARNKQLQEPFADLDGDDEDDIGVDAALLSGGDCPSPGQGFDVEEAQFGKSKRSSCCSEHSCEFFEAPPAERRELPPVSPPFPVFTRVDSGNSECYSAGEADDEEDFSSDECVAASENVETKLLTRREDPDSFCSRAYFNRAVGAHLHADSVVLFLDGQAAADSGRKEYNKAIGVWLHQEAVLSNIEYGIRNHQVLMMRELEESDESDEDEQAFLEFDLEDWDDE